MDWKNIDLENGYERDQNILDPYSFNDLLLEVSCNIRKEDINEITVRRQFETVLASRIEEARFIMRNNLKNIVKKAKES